MFRSVAKALGPRGLGVLLTGMGEDGAVGLLEMRQAGAYTIAEDESTAVVYGMPAAALRMGGVRASLPLDLIASAHRAARAGFALMSAAPATPGTRAFCWSRIPRRRRCSCGYVLETNGFNVTWRSTAEAALDSLNEKLPDLVIADFHLPGMNGDELSRQMRLNVSTRAIPVIMLTEARERAVERQGLESGADAYVSKSAEQALIILRIRALLRRRATPLGERAGQPRCAELQRVPARAHSRRRRRKPHDGPISKKSCPARVIR